MTGVWLSTSPLNSNVRFRIGSGVGVGGIASGVGAVVGVTRTGPVVATTATLAVADGALARSTDTADGVDAQLTATSAIARINGTRLPHMKETLGDLVHTFRMAAFMLYSGSNGKHLRGGGANMNTTGPSFLAKLGAIALSSIMLMALLVTMAAPEASASGPCPWYGIQDVFDDPDGNWDGDQVLNGDELYNGLNPCIKDTNEYCAGGGNPLCIYYTYVYVPYQTQCQISTSAYPTGDYDGDGISNRLEIANYADPCTKPCPHPTNADLSLNPNGDWDNDRISNALEVSQGTNPCNAHAYNPCPHYTYYQLQRSPLQDWDLDGTNNSTEHQRGTNPCQYNAPVTYYNPAPKKHVPTTHRLPHVARTYVPKPAPKPVVIPTCPHGYPYYHAGNGKCYANPVKGYW